MSLLTSEKKGVLTITPEELKSKLDHKEALILVDVRSKAEYDQGHIPGSIAVPLEQLETVAEDVLKDKDADIVLYCQSGKRAAYGVIVLGELGYENVQNFGGILNWPFEILSSI